MTAFYIFPIAAPQNDGHNCEETIFQILNIFFQKLLKPMGVVQYLKRDHSNIQLKLTPGGQLIPFHIKEKPGLINTHHWKNLICSSYKWTTANCTIAQWFPERNVLISSQNRLDLILDPSLVGWSWRMCWDRPQTICAGCVLAAAWKFFSIWNIHKAIVKVKCPLTYSIMISQCPEKHLDIVIQLFLGLWISFSGM